MVQPNAVLTPATPMLPGEEKSPVHLYIILTVQKIRWEGDQRSPEGAVQA